MWIEAKAGSGGGGGGTTLTPSNSSPATITNGTDYTADGNGYAIASYSNVTPDNAIPPALTAGNINKMTGNGYAINSYTRLNITTAPVSLQQGGFYTPGANCFAISNYYDLFPSDATPTYLTQGVMYRARDTGVVVGDVHAATPSDSDPFYMYDDAYYKPTANGYLYETLQTGGDLVTLMTNLAASAKLTTSNAASISVTSGKTYLLFALAAFTSSSATTTLSGATEIWSTSLVNTQASNSRYGLGKCYLCKATASSITVTFNSATNGRGYIAFQLD